MKVIHLISGGDTGGAKTHIHYLLSGLSKEIDVTLVCFMRGEFSEEAEALGIPTIVLEGSIPSVLRRLKAMIREGNYDLIHSHGARGNFLASLLKGPCGLPMITTVHSDPKLDYLGRPAAALVYGTLNDLALKKADYLVGVSDAMKSLLISRGFPANEIFTIYNGVDFSVVPKNPDRLGYLRSLGLDCDEESVVVGIAARLDPVKDVGTLIKGFAAAEKKQPQLRLVIAGDGAQMDELKALAQNLGVAEKVCFAGWRSDVNTLMAALDINTLTSLSETFPYAITEGARAHLATVSSRVGGVPKLVVEGETGFLFPAGDAEALGEKLALLAADPALRHRLGEALFQKAKNEFSVEATTRHQLDIYDEVLRREKRKAANERHGVVIIGAYGMGNSGDDAILEAIVGELRRIDPFLPITALSRRPKETRERYSVESLHMFDIPGFRRVLKGTQLYLSGGGSLIQNVTSRRSLWYYLYTISQAKKRGNRVMMYGCGIGPIADERDTRRVCRILNENVDVITLRESASLRELQRYGVTKPVMAVTSDPALTLPEAPSDIVDAELEKFGLAPDGAYICFSVRGWTGFDEKARVFAAAADYTAETLGLTPVFMLINRDEDGPATDLVRSLMKAKAPVIDGERNSSLTIGLLARMKAVVSMRLHGLIFAASQGIPLVGVSYDPKVTAFLESIGEKRCLPLSELTVAGLNAAVAEAVEAYADRDARKQVADALAAAESGNSVWARKLLEL
ncbi:MAG: polysaccharide pyruvyl transferase CsaB [Oscillospiraceae bacterium]